jgi:hypothetical protein
MRLHRRAYFYHALGFEAPGGFGSPDTKLTGNIGIYLY